ncbi:MAG: sugar phosphate isomerase/epimerase [Oscillospiraceae bacterium]
MNKGKIMNNIGFTSVTFRKKSFDEVLKIAKDANINCLEIGGDVHLPDDNIEYAKEIKRSLDISNMKAVSYGSYYRVGEKDFERFDRICQISDIIGSKIIRIWLGEKSSKKTSTSEFLEMVDEVKTLSDIAKKYNQTIGFEFHNNTFNDSAQSSNDFIAECNEDNIKTYWQPLYNGNDLENLKSVLPNLVTAHIFHWAKSGRRFSLKRGKKLWKEYLDVINMAGINCNFILEFSKKDSEKQFLKDVNILKSLNS